MTFKIKLPWTRKTSPLDQVPPELIEEILTSGTLTPKDMYNLCLVKPFSATAFSLLYKHIPSPPTVQQTLTILKKLDTFTDQQKRRVESLAITNDMIKPSGGNRMLSLLPIIPEDVNGLLKTLPNLHTLSLIHPFVTCTNLSIEGCMFPKLQSLTVLSGGNGFGTTLSRFLRDHSGLTELHIGCARGGENRNNRPDPESWYRRRNILPKLKHLGWDHLTSPTLIRQLLEITPVDEITLQYPINLDQPRLAQGGKVDFVGMLSIGDVGTKIKVLSLNFAGYTMTKDELRTIACAVPCITTLNIQVIKNKIHRSDAALYRHHTVEFYTFFFPYLERVNLEILVASHLSYRERARISL